MRKAGKRKNNRNVGAVLQSEAQFAKAQTNVPQLDQALYAHTNGRGSGSDDPFVVHNRPSDDFEAERSAAERTVGELAGLRLDEQFPNAMLEFEGKGVLEVVRHNHISCFFPAYHRPQTEEEENQRRVRTTRDVVRGIAMSYANVCTPDDVLAQMNVLKTLQREANGSGPPDFPEWLVWANRVDMFTMRRNDRQVDDLEERHQHFLQHSIDLHPKVVVFRCDASRPGDDFPTVDNRPTKGGCKNLTVRVCGGTLSPDKIAGRLKHLVQTHRGTRDIHIHCYELLETCPIVIPLQESDSRDDFDEVLFPSDLQFESTLAPVVAEVIPELKFNRSRAERVADMRRDMRGKGKDDRQRPSVFVHYYHQCVRSEDVEIFGDALANLGAQYEVQRDLAMVSEINEYYFQQVIDTAERATRRHVFGELSGGGEVSAKTLMEDGQYEYFTGGQ